MATKGERTLFEINKKTMRNVFLVIAAGIVLYWILHETERVKSVFGVVRSIFSPFVLGACLAFILNVPMRAFEKLFKKVANEKLRRVIAIALTFLALLIVLAGVFWLLIPQLIETVKSLIPALSKFLGDAEVFVEDAFVRYPQLLEWFGAPDLNHIDWTALIQKAVSVLGASLSSIISGTFSAISSVVGAIFNGVIAFVFALYCLFQKETLARQGRKVLYAFVPERFSDQVVRILRLTSATFSNFLSGQCIEVCILGCMFAIVMAICRMPYIPLISVLIAITAFIPYVGAFIGCVVGAFLIFVNNPLQAVLFVGIFLLIQQIEGNIIYPRVVGNSIGLNGMWVLIAISVGGGLFGVGGMFLMIPVASVIYTLLREITNKRLGRMSVDPEKLKNQPPEKRSTFKERREANKAKARQRRAERAAKKAENEQENKSL